MKIVSQSNYCNRTTPPLAIPSGLPAIDSTNTLRDTLSHIGHRVSQCAHQKLHC
uniref:Uncharacterized protein n=1 Tax=Arundo donax TaxID=35708 RepID=A0A0A9HJD2_ARUDO